MAICGIDLGTTNSLISVFDHGAPKLIPNASGEFLTPSVVYLSDRTVMVGAAALDRLVTDPELSAASFKRFMGSSRQVELGKASFRPEELSALVLQSLKSDAEVYLGETVSDVVISVPAYFNDQQRKATIDAGRLAGLNVMRIVNEPTAAVLAYGLSDAREGKYLAFDLGGGTFDVSILDKYEGVMEVRATTGDTRLGGNDFTRLLEEMIVEAHALTIDGLSLRDGALVRRAAEKLKIDLSRADSAAYSLPLSQKGIAGVLTRDAFEQRAVGLMRRLRAPLERAIHDAKLSPSDLDAIVLIGGATRMPMIRSMVARLFGRLPLVHVDPDTAVALGAAVQAGLSSRAAALDDIVMTDVCPYTLGVAVAEGPNVARKYVASIIERNAIVPISRNLICSTVADGQRMVRVEAYQGERLRPDDNVFIGALEVPVNPARAGAEQVDIRFTYDINGALEVEARSISLHVVHRAVFKNDVGLSQEELERRFAALNSLKMHPREQFANNALIARAERLYAEQTGFRRDAIRQLIADFETALLDQSQSDADMIRARFSENLDSFELNVFDPAS